MKLRNKIIMTKITILKDKKMEKFIKRLTKEAGEELLNYFKKENNLISLRGSSKEIVTKYDKLVDKFIIKEIKKHYSDHSILTEESGLMQKNSDFLWIVDSLDGSGNFANKNPLFSVCIALLLRGEIILGAIYAPVLQEFYFAEKEKGAFLNNKKISVSKIDDLKKSYLVYCEGNEKRRKKFAQILTKIYPKVTEIRKVGSAGIESAWVATGRIDGFFTTQIDPWDVAAGVLLVKEAGGQISNFENKNWQIKRDNFLFSNGKIHSKVLKYLN